VPPLSAFQNVLDATAEGREVSSTQTYVRILTTLLKDSSIGPRIVPILVDESRTFGMEGLFRQVGIFNQQGQLYEPVDKDQVMYYREDKAGQILQEGINEAGGMSSWIAAATSYSTNNRMMVPFYTYYSMFGMQRIGDLVWAAGDMRARGFLMGGTAGRTTLNGEGLQHEDGHSHLFAAAVPNCRKPRASRSRRATSHGPRADALSPTAARRASPSCCSTLRRTASSAAPSSARTPAT